MPKYLCQMVGFDDDADWHEVDVSPFADTADAARAYASVCKSRAGGEMLNEPDNDRERIRVRLPSSAFGEFLTYDVTMEWVERYRVRVVPDGELQKE